MRDNLVFCGIPESRGEDYEVDIKEFIDPWRNFFWEGTSSGKTRRVLYKTKTRRVSYKAKFSFFKDDEFIRKRAPLTLNGRNVPLRSSSHQRWRRSDASYTLRCKWPKGKTSVWNCDKLSIDGELHELNDTRESEKKTSHTRNFLTRRIPGNASDTPWTLWASGARRGNNPTPTLRRNKRDGFKEIVDTKKIAQVGGPEVTTNFHKDP